ncbi:MAG TPA: isochorismatase family cysteine hydrolase [Jatrophihabitans sp.]|nr:isochorismatase family cysteine hydrolase [Jatrophihabitans sp.]
MRLSRAATLVVIDMQNVFAEPASGWFTPGFDQILQPIRRLAEAFAGHAVCTRFVAPAEPSGAWQDYYRQWPFALQPPDWPGYQLVPAVAGLRLPTLVTSTFGKWVPELAERVDGELVLAGVSTDCCVLSTALAAADAGVRVLVAEQACAGADQASHQQALAAMRLYAPLVEVVDVDDLVRAARPEESPR